MRDSAESGHECGNQHQRVSWIQDDQPRQVKYAELFHLQPYQQHSVYTREHAEPSRDPPARRHNQPKNQQTFGGNSAFGLPVHRSAS
jgi:hypothetical protein